MVARVRSAGEEPLSKGSSFVPAIAFHADRYSVEAQR